MITHDFSDIGYPLIDLPCNNTIYISSKSKHADFSVNFQDLFNNPEIKSKCSEKKFGVGFNLSNNFVKFKIWPSLIFFTPKFSIINEFNDSEQSNHKIDYKLKVPCKIKNLKLCFSSQFNKEDHLAAFSQMIRYKNQPGWFKIKNVISMLKPSIYGDKLKIKLNRSSFLLKVATNDFLKGKFTIIPPMYFKGSEIVRQLLNTSISCVLKKEGESITREKCRIVNINNYFVCGLSYDFLKKATKIKNCSRIRSSKGKVAFALRYSKSDSYGFKVGTKYPTRFGKLYANIRSYPENIIVVGIKTHVNEFFDFSFYGGVNQNQNQTELQKMWSFNLEFFH